MFDTACKVSYDVSRHLKFSVGLVTLVVILLVVILVGRLTLVMFLWLW
jgi:hypothetical protein